MNVAITSFKNRADQRISSSYRESTSPSYATVRNVCPYVQPARAFDQLGRQDTTIALYEGYLAAPDVTRAAWDNENRGPVLERLAQLYDEAGDLENAALTYARFTELWEGADPELQPRVRAARARLQEILRERG